MNVLTGQDRLRHPALTGMRVPRLRPGEVPSWVDIALAPEEGREWRRRAQQRGIGVDAWLGVLVEFRCVAEFIHARGRPLDGPQDPVNRRTADARLAPTDALRRWVRLLDGQFAGQELPADELPTAMLPERVVAQVPTRALSETLRLATSDVDESLAISYDRVAALHGLTLESWALRLALSAAER